MDSAYEIHMTKINRIKDELEKKRSKKLTVDSNYENLKSQILNNKLRSHEFQEGGNSLLLSLKSLVREN